MALKITVLAPQSAKTPKMHTTANSIVVSVLSARGNFCYMLHEIEWCYSGLKSAWVWPTFLFWPLTQWMHCMRNVTITLSYFYHSQIKKFAFSEVCRFEELFSTYVSWQWRDRSKASWNKYLVLLSRPTLQKGKHGFWAHLCTLHGGLICIAFCLSVCPWLDQNYWPIIHFTHQGCYSFTA